MKWVKDKPGQIYRFTSYPTGDSLIMSYRFVFLKKGVFRIGGFQSSFYESSKGKTRWDAYFAVNNPNWDELWKVEGQYPADPNEEYYKKNYLIAVTD